jgi:hypothetical protein
MDAVVLSETLVIQGRISISNFKLQFPDHIARHKTVVLMHCGFVFAMGRNKTCGL